MAIGKWPKLPEMHFAADYADDRRSKRMVTNAAGTRPKRGMNRTFLRPRGITCAVNRRARPLLGQAFAPTMTNVST